MFAVKDFIDKYRHYSEGELIAIYNNIDGYSNKAKEALNIVIDEKGGLEKLLRNLADQKVITDEKERIAKEVFELGTQGVDSSLIKTLATSNILSADKVNEIIEKKFSEVEAEKADKAVTSRTIVGSIVGGLVASIIGGVLWGLQMVYSHKMIYMLLAGLVLLCYSVIKVSTKQTKKNSVVIIATVISVILALIIGQIVLEIMGFRGAGATTVL